MNENNGFFYRVRRLGFWRTCLGYVFNQLRKLVNVELVRVGANMEPATEPSISGFTNKVVDVDEYTALTEPEHERHRAFERGDHCVMTICEASGEYAGYNFFSKHPTIVNDWVEFYFPSNQFTYSYASFTPEVFRGRKIAPSRWSYYADWTMRSGQASRSIFYIDVTNFSSMLSSAEKERLVDGYTGYLKLGNFVWCWVSPECKKFGVGFRKR